MKINKLFSIFAQTINGSVGRITLNILCASLSSGMWKLNDNNTLKKERESENNKSTNPRIGKKEKKQQMITISPSQAIYYAQFSPNKCIHI